MGGRKKQRHLERRTHEYLEEKTPVERKQKLHTSRMDTRLRTPDSRRRREGRWEKNKDNFGQGNNIDRKEQRIDLPETKRVE